MLRRRTPNAVAPALVAVRVAMRNVIALTATLGLTLFSAGYPVLARESSDDSEMHRNVQDAAKQAQPVFDAMAEQYPALNVTVMQADTVIWEAAGGNNINPLDGVARRYNVYSVAKMITGMAFARLAQLGRVDLDQSVRDIDPALPDHYDPVTLRQLLNHTAGVRGYTGDADWIAFNDRRCSTPSDALGHFIDDPLVSKPGSTFGYTTYGFVIASHLLTKITGEAGFDAALKSALGPVFRGETDRDEAVKATNWFARGDQMTAIELSAECKFGGGGLIMSSQELAAMGADLAAGRVVALAKFDEVRGMSANQAGEDAAYALGMGGIRDTQTGQLALSHSGGAPGGRSFLLVLMEPQLSIAIAGNTDGQNLGELANALSGIYLQGAESD